MESNYYSKINELETLKKRNKILRQIRQSKEKLFIENPQVIIPYLRNKFNDDRIDNSYRTQRKQYSPIESRQSVTTPIIKTVDKDKEYLDMINFQKKAIEIDLENLRLAENRNKEDLNDRLQQFMFNQEMRITNAFEEIKSYFKLINRNQMDIHSYKLENENVLTELKNLKDQYLNDGGSNSQILRDIDSLVSEAEKNSIEKSNNDFNWKEMRKNMAEAREKSIELRELERYNVELEKQIEIDRVRSNAFNNKSRSPKIENDLKNTLESLRFEIQKVQQEIIDLKKPNLIEVTEPKARVVSRKLISAPKSSNFTIILDYITGISANITSATVNLTIFKENLEILKLVSLKPISVRPMKKNDLDLCLTLNSVQNISNCPVSRNTFGLIHLIMKSKIREELNLDAWTRFELFSDNNELNEGHWQVKIYNDPIQRFIDEEELLKLPQFHHAILHFRILSSFVNFNDQLTTDSIDSSKLFKSSSPVDNKVLNPVTIEPETIEINKTQTLDNDAESDVTIDLNETPEFGFQVIRVKNIAIGDNLRFAKVRLTVYYTAGPKKGEVLMSSNGPVTCCTNFVRADFKIACYQFGKQIGRFQSSDLSDDCVVYARFYMENNEDQSKVDNEELITWTAIPLVKHRKIAKDLPSHHTTNLKLLKINKALHDIPFYDLPIVSPNSISFDRNGAIIGQKRFGRAKLKLRIFHTKPIDESDTSSSDISSEDDMKKTKQPWIPAYRIEPLLSPYHQNDGIDLYVDSGRLWPDSVTIAKVTGRILNRSLVAQGPKFSTFTSFSSDIYNPEFHERIEIRQPQLSPSSTLLLKIFTFDREEGNVILFGYAALKIFVETGTNEQPSFDDLGVLVSLNDGGHQIRVYSTGPNPTTFPFSESWFETNQIPPILGATVLVRMYKAQKDAEGKTLSIHNTPKVYHRSLGVVLEAPSYDDGYYYSINCKPSEGERQILIEHLERPKLILRDLLNSKWSEKIKENIAFDNLHDVSDVIKIFDESTKSMFNMNRISQYNANYGFKIAIDGCINIPWASFSAATVSLSPPGALYMNIPLIVYDRPFVVSQLNLKSTPSAPLWTNGWKTYRRRKYDKYLTAIFHLHEMNIKRVGNNNEFSLENQAWIPIQIFDSSYCISEAVQLPLIVGAPKKVHLNELKTKSVKQFLIDNLASKNINYLGNASVIIRQCDTRRSSELIPSSNNNLLTLNQTYIPQTELTSYQSVYSSAKELKFSQMIPMNLNEELFQQMFRIKFKNLIYKFFSENGFNLN